MKQILAMSKPNAVCAIHGATANGFFKDTKIFDFNFAGLFSSAFFYVILRRSRRIQGSLTQGF